MTYEELLVCIGDEAPRLPGSALKLLLRLISIAIKTGSNEVEISARTLAADMNISRDAVQVASRALSDVLKVSTPHGSASRFTLPADWFEPQRSLFPAPPLVDNSERWPGKPATGGLETRPVAWKTRH